MEMVKTRQQIADEYGISRKTLSRWLKKAGIHLDGYLIAPKEQALIYQTFGDPRKKDKRVA
ncbi:MAG: helix-turn-helix domain-containing protein [Saprospiraceae bacterium]